MEPAPPEPTWSKEVESSYFRRIPDEALEQATRKPFSQSDRARLLVEIGTVLSLLPDPPARILDLGCGPGWTSSFFAQCGYEVLGIDFSPEAITVARATHRHAGLTFLQHDWDEPLDSSLGRFDVAVFIDCLHHSMDEVGPLRTAYSSLKASGSICVVCEPGTGHADSAGSLHAVEVFGVNERDMTPVQVVDAGRRAGFASTVVLPHPQEVHRSIFEERVGSGMADRFLATSLGRLVQVTRIVTIHKQKWGVVVLTK